MKLNSLLKKITTTGLLFFLLPINTFADTGCMSSTQNLKSYDNKQRHYVNCSCPCGSNSRYKIIANKQGLCRECGHTHELKPMQFLTIKTFPKPQIKQASKNPIIKFFQNNGSLLYGN